MNLSIQQLSETAAKNEKLVIGLMSGTSLDGLDIALCNIQGQGRGTKLQLLEFKTAAYSRQVAEKIGQIMSVEEAFMEEVCIIHSWLGTYHADLILEALREWDVLPGEIDCIASHGQTIYHAPIINHQHKGMPNATLQIGDGDHIAKKTGILTLSDFRQKHTAAGGEGAPMAALVDEALFRSGETDRLLLNIGGIANFTYLPAETTGESVVTTDTGPGNTLINATTHAFFDRPFDKDGNIASSGKPVAALLQALKNHPYFQKPPPKTTGPEVFNLEWVKNKQKVSQTENINPEDLIATLTWFSAETIADGIRNVCGADLPEIYLSGGGMHNKQMVKWLDDLMKGTDLRSFEEIGFNPDAKEAVCFAVLANEALSGKGFLIEPKQNSGRRVNFGKISLPV